MLLNVLNVLVYVYVNVNIVEDEKSNDRSFFGIIEKMPAFTRRISIT
jgi:hypothetical protein